MKRRTLLELLLFIGACAAVAAALVVIGQNSAPKRSPERNDLLTRGARFGLDRGTLHFESIDKALAGDIELSIVVDGVPQEISRLTGEERLPDDVRGGTFSIDLGDDSAAATLSVHPSKTEGALKLSLSIAGSSGTRAPHAVALRAATKIGRREVFASGIGDLSSQGEAETAYAVLDFIPHPLAFTSPEGPLAVASQGDDPTIAPDDARVSVVGPAVTLRADSNDAVSTELRLLIGESSSQLFRLLWEERSVAALHVRGAVTGATGAAVVFGRDETGAPRVRFRTDDSGHFELEAPKEVVGWFATIDAMHTSALVHYEPGADHDLHLDVSPGGELHVTITDADTDAKLTARLLVRGEQGAVDPNFGPDYRASGAGPDIDVLRGEVTTPLPSGHYRVAATKGLEWTIDEKHIEITPGKTTDVALAPRRVVPTPLSVACDLHVHARPSFDTPVSTEDRVLSLVTAGIEFAVPTEHNIVGDYSNAVNALGLDGELLWVSGVEVTTYSRSFGHFGVFPYPVGTRVPPFKGTTLGAVIAASRGGDPSRFLQIHHPRLPKGIGYFNVSGFDPKGNHPGVRIHREFDGIEVFNGYDTERPERVQAVLRDYYALLNDGRHLVATGSSDSHRIQFHWAGYPRTMVRVSPNEKKEAAPIEIVQALKRGHATVTSGPIIELSFGSGFPGDVVKASDGTHGHIRVLAAPWVDVTHADIIVRGEVARSFDIPTRPLHTGEEPGSRSEVEAGTIRLDSDFELPPLSPGSWVMAVVTGERRMDDILPFMPVPPFAFTNPIYVEAGK